QGATGLSSPISVTVIDSLPLSSDAARMNWQTTLLEQKVRLSNPTPLSLLAGRVSISGLAEGTRVYNASGDVDGVPFVTYSQELAPGATAELTIEYYVLDRQTPQAQLSAKPVAKSSPTTQEG